MSTPTERTALNNLVWAAEEMVAVLDSGHDWEGLHHTTPERGAYDRLKLAMWEGQRARIAIERERADAPHPTTEGAP